MRMTSIRLKLLIYMLLVCVLTIALLVGLTLPGYSEMAGQDLTRLISLYVASLIVLIGTGIYLVDRLLIKPIKDLTVATRQLAQGNYDIRLPATRHDEIGVMTESFGILQHNLQASLQNYDRENNTLNETLIKLQASEARARGIFDNVQDGLIITDGLGAIVAVNPALCDMTGYTASELINNNVNSLVPEHNRSQHQRDVVNFALDEKRLKRPHKHVTALLKDGNTIPVEISLSQLRSNNKLLIIAVVHDIRQRVQAEHALRYERDRAQSYLDTAEVAIISIDTKCLITLINRKGCTLLGYSEGELLGVDYFSLCPDQSVADEMREAYQQHVLNNEVFPKYFYITLRTRAGQDRIFEWHNNTVKDYEWNTAGIILAGVDMTDIRKSIDERKALRERLHQAQKMQAIGQLSSGIAHDFNNLLASIMGYTELLQDILSDADESVAGYLKEIYASGVRARDLVEGMLQYSRNAKKIGETSANTLYIPAMADDLSKMLHNILPDRIAVSINIPQDAIPVTIDSINLQQLIINMSLNAVDAMPDAGNLVITCLNDFNYHGECTSCGKSFNGNYLKLAVSDTGCGIGNESLSRLFEPFYTTKIVGEAGKGTGMGLAVVHGIIHDAGGHIIVESKPGVGTSFKVYIPAATEQTMANVANA